MTGDKPKLLIATTNVGKLAELNALLVDLPIRLLSLRDLSSFIDIEETGTTFKENAVLKASGYAKQAGMAAIADDSGLEVSVLDNRPGVYSARYGGEDIDFDKKMGDLIVEMDKTGDPDRSARFVCCAALADASGRLIHLTEGFCSGTIAAEQRGISGFGYDPIFVPDGFDQTFGELSDDIKQRISHRARAFALFIPFLRDNIAILT